VCAGDGSVDLSVGAARSSALPDIAAQNIRRQLRCSVPFALPPNTSGLGAGEANRRGLTLRVERALFPQRRHCAPADRAPSLTFDASAALIPSGSKRAGSVRQPDVRMQLLRYSDSQSLRLHFDGMSEGGLSSRWRLRIFLQGKVRCKFVIRHRAAPGSNPPPSLARIAAVRCA